MKKITSSDLPDLLEFVNSIKERTSQVYESIKIIQDYFAFIVDIQTPSSRPEKKITIERAPGIPFSGQSQSKTVQSELHTLTEPSEGSKLEVKPHENIDGKQTEASDTTEIHTSDTSTEQRHNKTQRQGEKGELKPIPSMEEINNVLLLTPVSTSELIKNFNERGIFFDKDQSQRIYSRLNYMRRAGKIKVVENSSPSKWQPVKVS